MFDRLRSRSIGRICSRAWDRVPVRAYRVSIKDIAGVGYRISPLERGLRSSVEAPSPGAERARRRDKLGSQIHGSADMVVMQSKRRLLVLGGALAAVAAPALITLPALAERKGGGGKRKGAEKKDEDVSPPEDLMREHGVLDRVLLLYEAGIRKFASNDDFDPEMITQSAGIIRDFINNYHEKSEEEHVFPRFRKAGRMTDLVDVLLRQHEAGRKVTDNILRLAPTGRGNTDDRKQLVGAMQSFITMYRPHAAREDTDLFPKLKDVVSSNEYDAMAEDFEKKEHQLFGEDGFEKMAARVAQLEQQMGIHDLNQFTPR
ncbi:hemerythrin domain-containing protein [uncultured Bradyrhizobium sp.]|uniref:hemerythrin domain-containing protein n=1 Tax=uncultured Bradyrhizobium sp. TaxID=199684 RepID=UPI00262CED7C|nr:hemerythrin domain-containing protein [uncultured Bradyrhizobium sp.]